MFCTYKNDVFEYNLPYVQSGSDTFYHVERLQKTLAPSETHVNTLSYSDSML